MSGVDQPLVPVPPRTLREDLIVALEARVKNSRRFRWAAPLVLVLSASLIMMGSWMGGAPAVSEMGFVVLILAGISVIIWYQVHAKLLREQRLLAAVRAHGEQLCPDCGVPLEEAEGETRCPSCDVPIHGEELADYWGRIINAKPGAPIAPYAGGQRGPCHKRLLKAARESPRGAALYWLIAWVLIVTLMTLLSGQHWLVAAADQGLIWLAFALLMIGVSWWQISRLRVGQTRHCRACDYQQAPQGDLPERCPECGANWLVPGAVLIGTRQDRPELRQAALAMFVLAGLVTLGAISPLVGLGRAGWRLQVVPTAALISDAVHSDTFTRDTWTELNRRTLTPAQVVSLAGGLLERRRREAYLGNQAGPWLYQQVAGGQLPAEIVECYYREMLDVEIAAPPAARVGEPFVVRIVPDYRNSGLPPGVDDVVYFGGFFVGDDPEPIGRRELGTPQNLLDNAKYEITAEVVAPQPGLLPVRSVLYLAVRPTAGMVETPEWKPDGTADLPASVIWSQRVEVERTVLIRE